MGMVDKVFDSHIGNAGSRVSRARYINTPLLLKACSQDPLPTDPYVFLWTSISNTMNAQGEWASERTKATFPFASTPAHPSLIPSSSPAFGTPVHPIRLQKPPVPSTKPTVLPILLPPATLRPLAFRTFTKKHNLTLTSAALQALATFIGRHCGSGWREEGLAEGVLEETAKAWKKDGGGVIVEAEGHQFKDILKNLESCMNGGRLVQQYNLSRQRSLICRAETGIEQPNEFNERLRSLSREDSQASLRLSVLEVDDNENEENQERDPKNWIKIVGAFEQPHLVYNASQKHFEKASTGPSLLPDPLHKTALFRHRYNLIHQRLLRNESFQIPTITHSRVPTLQRSSSAIATTQQAYKLTPIANLLGRSGSSHLLLGILTISPTGMSALSDLTGSIVLELRHARPVPEDGAWFTPGMIVLVDGVYEEEGFIAGTALGGGGGVGGTIGGKFLALSVGGPPCERREVTLGIGGPNKSGDLSAGGGFGWVDFLGVGSEKATGSEMRKLEKSILRQEPKHKTAVSRGKIAILGEVNLDNAKTMQALQKILTTYAANSMDELPITFILIGNFVQHAAMAGGGSGGSIEYKEYFDSLASVLSEYPRILQTTTFVFVPGDNDPWASSFSAGAATVLPRKEIPELFTTRVKRAFVSANAETETTAGTKANGEAIWTTNPARISLFGPIQEIVVFRDNLSSRLRRAALSFQSNEAAIDELQEDSDTHQDTPSVDHYESELMDIDDAVKDAESHIPAPKVKEPVEPLSSSDLHTARKLVKTILDQGYLSPFPLSHRPVLWDFAGSLQLYPLPTALVLVDPDAPHFTVTYEGCHVMNPGRLVAEGRKGVARWIEYDAGSRRGRPREVTF